MKKHIWWMIVAIGGLMQIFLAHKYNISDIDFIVAIMALITVQIGARLDEMNK